MLPPIVFIALLTAVLMVPVVPFITALMVPIRLLMKTPHAATVGKLIKHGIYSSRYNDMMLSYSLCDF